MLSPATVGVTAPRHDLTDRDSTDFEGNDISVSCVF
jgi:hypothetical protein